MRFGTENAEYGDDYTIAIRYAVKFGTNPDYSYQSQKINWVNPQILRFYFTTKWEEIWDNMI